MLTALKVGTQLPNLEKNITQERINQWADISGDFNPLHVDAEYAAKTHFKGTIAHGPMSLAFLNELMMNCFELHWVKGGMLKNVRFISPIRPGDRITISGNVKNIYKQNNNKYVECDVYVEKMDGTKAVTGQIITQVMGGQINEDKETAR